MSNAPQSSPASAPSLRDITKDALAAEAKLREGGGSKAIARQHEKGRLTAEHEVAGMLELLREVERHALPKGQ